MFHAPKLMSYLNHIWTDPYTIAIDDDVLNLWKFLNWFKPTEQWLHYLRVHYKKYVFITFHKPTKLLPHEPVAPIQDEPNESPFNNSMLQAWYSYNLAKTSRSSWNEDWYDFLARMCQYNNVNIDTIPPEILWGQIVWDSRHPLSNNLLDRLFDFAETNDFLYANGLQSSNSDGPFVDPVADLDENEYPDTD